MDRKTALAIILCLLIYLGWQKFYLEPRFPKTSAVSLNQAQPQQPMGSVPGTPATSSAHQTEKANIPAQIVPIQTEIGQAYISNRGPLFADWSLKGYKLGISAEAAAVDLQSVAHQKGEFELAFDDTSFAYLNDVSAKLSSQNNSAQWSYEDDQIKIVKQVQAHDQQPYADVLITAEFKKKSPKYGFLSLSTTGSDQDQEAQDHQLVYWTNQSLERLPIKDASIVKEIGTPVKYIGTTNRYFLFTVVNQSPVQPIGLIQPLSQGSARISMVYPISGNTLSIPVRVYFGPKELNVLRRVEPTLDHTIDFGWFTVFAYPLLNILKWLYQFVQNYGTAIILLTLLLKIATYPLTYKSMKSMKKMSKLQPQLQKIREKHKDDREALNREMMSLMRTQGYNPMAGCLPMLVQMPIFFALYRVLYSSIELYHAPFALWIHDLSSRDPYYVTPILLSLTMFVQQKLTPNTATDPAQQRMMQLMPLIFGAFMLALPAGLTIYMLVNAIASIVQQIILNKKLDIDVAKAK